MKYGTKEKIKDVILLIVFAFAVFNIGAKLTVNELQLACKNEGVIALNSRLYYCNEKYGVNLKENEDE